MTMERRTFLKTGLTAGAGALTTATASPAWGASPSPRQEKPHFKLSYAPHFGMFEHHAGDDPIDQLQFMADRGFTALEDNGMMERPVEVQERIGEEMARLDMTMGVFVIDGGDNWKTSLTTGKPEFVETFVETCREAVDVARRVNATWMTVVPGFYERNLPLGIQTAHVVEALRRGAEIIEPHGLVMVLEPLSDTPELFLRRSDQTYEICKAVDSPSCKILYDVYHMQRNEGNLINNIEATWDEIAYFQVGDNPGRNEPTTGEINYKNIFKYLYENGYDGVIGMEHGNAGSGEAGEQAVIDAYVACDSFET